MVGQEGVRWSIQCDAKGCGSHFEETCSSCMSAMHDAAEHGWHVMRDGTSYCPTHADMGRNEL